MTDGQTPTPDATDALSATGTEGTKLATKRLFATLFRMTVLKMVKTSPKNNYSSMT
jgi:hypothetical protein